jgi:hypothetical protein
MSGTAHNRSPLAARFGPRSSELPGSGTARLVETTILVLVAILLATAAIYDTVRQSDINGRLVADLATWRAYTGVDSQKVSLSQELLGAQTGREVACGPIGAAGGVSARQLCLAIWGPVRGGRRGVHGGWYLPAKAEDERRRRYGCFGEGARGMCP